MSVSLTSAEPVGQRVHVAVLDDRLVDDQREHGRGRLELRDVRRVRADLARDLEQAVDRLLDAPDRHHEHAEQDRDDHRRDRADPERDRPVLVEGERERPWRSLADRHLPEGPRGVQDPDARVVDPRDAAELGGLRGGSPRPPPRPSWPACAILSARATIVMTIAAAIAITTTPTAIPNCHQPDDAISASMPRLPHAEPGRTERGVSSRCPRARAVAPDPSREAWGASRRQTAAAEAAEARALAPGGAVSTVRASRSRTLIRYDRRADMHEAFLGIACCLICWRRLQNSLC